MSENQPQHKVYPPKSHFHHTSNGGTQPYLTPFLMIFICTVPSSIDDIGYHERTKMVRVYDTVCVTRQSL